MARVLQGHKCHSWRQSPVAIHLLSSLLCPGGLQVFSPSYPYPFSGTWRTVKLSPFQSCEFWIFPHFWPVHSGPQPCTWPALLQSCYHWGRHTQQVSLLEIAVLRTEPNGMVRIGFQDKRVLRKYRLSGQNGSQYRSVCRTEQDKAVLQTKQLPGRLSGQKGSQDTLVLRLKKERFSGQSGFQNQTEWFSFLTALRTKQFSGKNRLSGPNSFQARKNHSTFSGCGKEKSSRGKIRKKWDKFQEEGGWGVGCSRTK